jgi:hypothetical protein
MTHIGSDHEMCAWICAYKFLLECIGMTSLPQDDPTHAAYNNQSGHKNTR